MKLLSRSILSDWRKGGREGEIKEAPPKNMLVRTVCSAKWVGVGEGGGVRGVGAGGGGGIEWASANKSRTAGLKLKKLRPRGCDSADRPSFVLHSGVSSKAENLAVCLLHSGVSSKTKTLKSSNSFEPFCSFLSLSLFRYLYLKLRDFLSLHAAF